VTKGIRASSERLRSHPAAGSQGAVPRLPECLFRNTERILCGNEYLNRGHVLIFCYDLNLLLVGISVVNSLLSFINVLKCLPCHK